MRVTIMSYVPFRSMDAHGRLLSCYWHACICYTNGTAMSNQSLRSRFGDDVRASRPSRDSSERPWRQG